MSAVAIMMSVFCVLCYTGQNFFNKLYSIHYNKAPEAATPVFYHYLWSVYGSCDLDL